MRRKKMFGMLDRVTSRMQRMNKKTIRVRDSLGEVEKQLERIGKEKR